MAKAKYSKKKTKLKELPAQAQKALISGQTEQHAIVRAHIEDDFWGAATLAELWYTNMPMLWVIYYDAQSSAPELMGFHESAEAWGVWQKIAEEYGRFIQHEPSPNPMGPEEAFGLLA